MSKNPEVNPEEEDSVEAGEALPQIESTEDLARIIQALVFASPEVVTLRKLREVLGDFLDARLVAEALQSANDQLNRIQSPFEIVEHAGGYRFRTRAKYYPWVRKLFPEMNLRRLSQAALETLAVVAYKQPITRAGIESIRGVSCDAPLRGLLEKKLVALGPRAETVGSPYTYVTTPDFLKYFGINQIPGDLPRLTEFDDLLQAGALVPQYKKPEAIAEPLPEWPLHPSDPNQVELSMGDPE
jgi:segregation and condensation protein B